MSSAKSDSSALPLFGDWVPATWLRRLACHRAQEPFSADEIWLMCRMSMWATLSQTRSTANDWRVHYAQAAGHAACGHTDLARAEIQRFLSCPEASLHRWKLAASLAAYLPEDALRLMKPACGEQENPLFLASLYLRLARPDEARRVLAALTDEAAQRWPELPLLQTNVNGGSPAEQMRRLNRFVTHYGLAPLILRDSETVPSPLNVFVQESVEQITQGPLVSVLMTTFRVGERLSTAIESVLAQSWRNLELIVVDDASGDDTGRQITAWAQRDTRIKPVLLPSNVGTYAAKLIGLKYAKGEFITCHDADDWSHPEKIARQMRVLLDDEQAVAVDSYWLRMQDDGRFYTRWVFRLLDWNASSLLFRRHPVLDKAGAWDPLKYGVDCEFAARLRVIFGDERVKKLHCPLSLGSHRADSLMNIGRTGFPASTGETVENVALWDAWVRWHIQTLAKDELPFISADIELSIKQRAYDVAEEFVVPERNVFQCLEALKGEA